LRGQDHDVDVAIDRLLVGVEAQEPARFRNIDAVAVILLQLGQTALESIAERRPSA
jgi:hypothetical protein